MLIKDAGFLRLDRPAAAPGRRARRAGADRAARVGSEQRGSRSWLTGGSRSGCSSMYLRVPRTPFVGNYVAREGVLSTDVLSGQPARRDPERRSSTCSSSLGSIAGILVVLAAVPFLVDLPRRVRERDIRAAGSGRRGPRVRHRRLRGRLLARDRHRAPGLRPLRAAGAAAHRAPRAPRRRGATSAPWRPVGTRDGSGPASRSRSCSSSVSRTPRTARRSTAPAGRSRSWRPRRASSRCRSAAASSG